MTFGVVLSVMLVTSCESLLEVSPEEVLLSDDYLGDDEQDARSALFGVLSQMQDLAGQYVVLGEMRADLVDISPDATEALRQINNHNVTQDNSFADPTTLFSIINNCNFAIEGIDTEAYENQLLDDYASIVRIRTWAQLQILIHFGKLPYITTPISSNNDLVTPYPLLSFEDGISKLIENLELIADVENVSKYENSLGFNIFKMIPDGDILLGDLYLWQGHYILSATHYKKFLDDHVSGNLFNLRSYGSTTEFSGGEYNVSTSWEDIYDDNLPSNEVINYTAFDEQYRQTNTSFTVFSEQMICSPLMIQNWLSQIRGFEGEPYLQGDLPGDFVRSEGSLDPLDSSKIRKYQLEYFMWSRAAKVYLRYAEAVNYAGYPEHALSIINGIFNNPNVDPVDAPIFNNVQQFLNFDMGQYYTVNTNDQPTDGNQGIRGRVGLAPVTINEDLTVFETPEKIRQVGEHILNEAALELAFEGNRWEDLLRFAKRANNPAILADAVYSKFEISGNASEGALIQQKLMNQDNWYLPLEIPENFRSAN